MNVMIINLILLIKWNPNHKLDLTDLTSYDLTALNRLELQSSYFVRLMG